MDSRCCGLARAHVALALHDLIEEIPLLRLLRISRGYRFALLRERQHSRRPSAVHEGQVCAATRMRMGFLVPRNRGATQRSNRFTLALDSRETLGGTKAQLTARARSSLRCSKRLQHSVPPAT